MKISKEPKSAFAIYSEKLKQKKKPKLVATNGISKASKKDPTNYSIKLQQMLGSTINNGSSTVKQKVQHNNLVNVNLSPVLNKKKTKNKNRSVNNLITPFKPKSEIINGFVEMSENKLGLPCAKTFLCTKPLVDQETNPKKVKSVKHTKSSLDGQFIAPNKGKPKLKNKNPHLVPFRGTKTYSSNVGTLLEQEPIEKRQPTSKAKKGNQNKSKTHITKNKSNNINYTAQQKSQQDIDWSNQENSMLAAKHLFEWLTKPVKQQDFMRDYWEKQPLLIQRESNRNYFSELLSTPAVDRMLRQNIIYFTKHLDVTSYSEGVRETHNLSGRAQANVVWDFYSNGCSIRLLNPQAFLPKIHMLNATLQEHFGCFVGANVYLTPPNSQGFAPHYDDIEAFILQIEGKKHWKVYQPRNDKETLPRFSSPNFSQEEIGNPFLDVVLEPGDMLYFPRGFIHQASTVDREHSLHITLSAYQKTAWVDLLEKALPIALKRAAMEDVDFRRGLPRDYLGLEHHGSDKAKMSFTDTAQMLMKKMSNFLTLSLGAGVDQMGAQFMHDSLPPLFTSEEKKNSSIGGGLTMNDEGRLVNRVELDLNTRVKLIRANVCRLVEEEDEVRLYHCLDNPLEYHAEEPQFLVLPQEGVSVITFLSAKYPSFVELKRIPHDDDEALLALMSDLWDAGLILTKKL